MKYGRTYETLLAAAHEDWREHAIHYKELKKIINRIAEELDSLGLTSEVLADLLRNAPTSPTSSTHRPKSISVGKGKRKARAQYELDGTADHPEPRIRIVFSSASEASGSDEEFGTSRLTRQRSDRSDVSAFLEELDDETSPDEGFVHSSDLAATRGPKLANELLLRLYGKGVPPASEGSPPGSPINPKYSSPPLSPRKAVVAKAEDPVDAMLAASLMLPPVMDLREEGASDGDTEGTGVPNGTHIKVNGASRRKRRPRKEIVISLDQDSQFFELLGGALQSLEQLELQQKAVFTQDVSSLASRISTLSSPSKPKSDLYGWRDVFALWIEAEIFQGATELDRKEHSVEETERRLQWFIDQVGRRKLAKKMRNKDSAAALEQFVALNVQLLDLKRFQEANELAARKILKKHDKRTALTAASDFPLFVKMTHHMNESPRSLVIPGYPTLPRLLQIQFTTALLPIVPQIDDYSCIICGDIAYKPIRLDCGHRFCVRCLVKMQKRQQNACPSCRAPVVLTANAANLDAALQSWLKLYFPREVKAKSNENGREVASEQMQEMGLVDRKCVVS